MNDRGSILAGRLFFFAIFYNTFDLCIRNILERRFNMTMKRLNNIFEQYDISVCCKWTFIDVNLMKK